MKKKYIALLTLFTFNYLFTQIGINTASPTQVIDVNGTVRLRGIPGLVNPPTSFPTGTDPLALDNNNFSNVLVSRTDGVVGSRSYLQLQNDIRAWTISQAAGVINSNVNLSAVAAKDLADLYVVDYGSTITLPTCGTGGIDGKIFTIYKWGGTSSSPVIIRTNTAGNIFNAADPSLGFTPPAGIVYNNSGGINGSGTTTNISVAMNFNPLRFTILRMVCIPDVNKWFFDHNVR
ncbi:hypothetical protein F3J23_18710 [Chryseobacterium sp. Tr-659]|uniref:hypothetical protein n=1 Tax=Chryseobacterium sp. Tr-659 TaxID=2608340 RepID=UPI001421A461|nr:hypothetical protein [Chryseobacterium sp. Tr-659]NIF07456.1 hypothetical protein [Chryseobacterium sp. Tr-659]